MKNSVSGGFLKKYRTAMVDDTLYIPLTAGFLRLEYSHETGPYILTRVSFTADSSEHSRAIGNLLEFSISADKDDGQATFIAEEGVSGIQWSAGEVVWGHAYDDDSPPSKGRKISLESWIDECVEKIIKTKNPIE